MASIEPAVSTNSYEIDIEEVEYLRHNGKSYMARLFRPRGIGPFPAVIDAHGGAWCAGHRSNNDPINSAMARAGVVVAAVDFRVPPEAGYPGSVADINYAIRWLKWQAANLNSRSTMVGSMGTSSGGHLVVLDAIRPRDSRYAALALPSTAPSFDAGVRFVITLWPVISPLGRYRYVKDGTASAILGPSRRADIAAHHERYWVDEAGMADGDPVMVLGRGETVELPPILYLQNPADPLHPRADLDRFVTNYRRAGGDAEVELFEGPVYDLLRSQPTAPAAKRALQRMAAFAYRHM